MKSGLSLSRTRSTQYVVLEQTERLAGAFHTQHLAQSRDRGLAVTLCHTLLPFTIRRTSVVTVNPLWHKSFVLVSRPLVYLNALNLANHKSDAHISKISLNKSKYFKVRLTKIVNYTTEHLYLRHSEFVQNRQTHLLCYTLSSCRGLKTKCCRCVAKPKLSRLIKTFWKVLSCIAMHCVLLVVVVQVTWLHLPIRNEHMTPSSNQSWMALALGPMVLALGYGSRSRQIT